MLDSIICVKSDRDITVIGDHSVCYRHRVCNEEFPCEVCSNWLEEKRTVIKKMINRKNTEARRKSATTRNLEVPLCVCWGDGNLNHSDSQVFTAGNVAVSENISPIETRQNCGDWVQGSVPPQVYNFHVGKFRSLMATISKELHEKFN